MNFPKWVINKGLNINLSCYVSICLWNVGVASTKKNCINLIEFIEIWVKTCEIC